MIMVVYSFPMKTCDLHMKNLSVLANPTACMQTGTRPSLTPTFNQPVQHFLMESQIYSLKKSIPLVPSSLEPHLDTHPSLHNIFMTKLPNMMNTAGACIASLTTSKLKHHYSVTAFKVPFLTYLPLILPSAHHLP
jgi:hypothetical protein